MRLDRFLCEMNIGTRSKVKALLKQGLVTVNGQTVTRPEVQLDVRQDQVTYQGQLLEYEEFVYYMLHKPAGVVSATSDRRERTVVDLLSADKTVAGKDIFPVGRLDKDTEGLVLLTNDGQLAHKLLSPKKAVTKLYYVQLEKNLTREESQCLEAGLDIGDDTPTLPAQVTVVGEKAIWLAIQEGRFHQVKRMMQAVGNQVVYLKRLAIGPLELDDSLAKGQFRRLTAAEVAAIKGQ